MTRPPAATPRPLEADLHERLHQPGPLVTITKGQAAWLLDRHSAFDSILAAADTRIEALEARLAEAERLLRDAIEMPPFDGNYANAEEWPKWFERVKAARIEARAFLAAPAAAEGES